MPSQHLLLTGVSLTLDMGYLLMATLLTLDIGHSDLGHLLSATCRGILGISELKWTGMGEFNSDDHYIYYCGQESFRRNGVATIVNKRV